MRRSPACAQSSYSWSVAEATHRSRGRMAVSLPRNVPAEQGAGEHTHSESAVPHSRECRHGAFAQCVRGVVGRRAAILFSSLALPMQDARKAPYISPDSGARCACRAMCLRSREQGTLAYWMCGEGGHCAERCATMCVVSQGNTCAHEWPHPSPDRGARCACREMCQRSMNQGSFCILDVRGGRSARGALCHCACG